MSTKRPDGIGDMPRSMTRYVTSAVMTNVVQTTDHVRVTMSPPSPLARWCPGLEEMTHSSKQTVLGMRHTFERRLQLRRREHNHPHASWALNKSETTLALHALQPGEPGGIRHGDVRGRRARNDHNSSKLASNRKDEVRDGLIYS